MHFEYDGFRLPRVGEWYLLAHYDANGPIFYDEAKFVCSSINFTTTPQQVYLLVENTPTPKGWDEW